MRTETALLVALVVALSVVAVPAGAMTAEATAAHAPQQQSSNATATANHPPDPPSDRIGWESVDGHGIWYNETIAVDNSDGINRTELDLLVARTMARDEQIRQLEFDKTVPVDIRSREAYKRNVTKGFSNTSMRDRVHQNVKFEATFMVAESNDTIVQQSSNRAASTLGYYSPTEDAIVIVSDDTSTLQMDEFTLAHELVHALQDQHFNITRYNRTTEDQNDAVNGIVEGDAHYTEKLYKQRCSAGGAWNGTCIRPTDTAGGSGGQSDINIGMYLVSFQPYSDGPPFVDEIRQRGGWDAVNQVYQNPPETTEQTIHPQKYLEDSPTNISFEDRSDSDWHVLDLGNGSINYATFGEAGLFSMMWYPGYRSRTDPNYRSAGNDIIPNVSLLQASGQFDAYNYDSPITAGWDGDKLYPYVPTGEPLNYTDTGYVWKLAWDSPSDASQFVDGYQKLLDFYGASSVQGHANTYRIPDSKDFGDAFYVTQSGSTVTIVNGPTVADLPKIRAGAAPATNSETTTAPGTTTSKTTTGTGTETGSGTASTTSPSGTEPGTTDTGSGNAPGFGLAAGLLALLAAALVASRAS